MDAPPPVLYAEDDEMDVLLLRRAWERAGLPNPLHVVPDGEEAQAYLTGKAQYADRRAHPMPCLVLLDLKMPKRSGLEVLQWIREQPPPLGMIPVAVYSSSNAPRDKQQANALGANAYLVKSLGGLALDDIIAQLKVFCS